MNGKDEFKQLYLQALDQPDYIKICNVNFTNDEGDADQTQFDAENVTDLVALWVAFCEENRFDPLSVTGIELVELQHVKVNAWLEDHDGTDYCTYCCYQKDCPQGMVCHGGSPVEPPCCSVSDITKLLDVDQLLEDLLADDA